MYSYIFILLNTRMKLKLHYISVSIRNDKICIVIKIRIITIRRYSREERSQLMVRINQKIED